MLHSHTNQRNFLLNSVTRHTCTIFVHFLLNAFSLYSHFHCFECQSTDGKLSLTRLGFIRRLNVNFIISNIFHAFNLFYVAFIQCQDIFNARKMGVCYDFHLFNYPLDLIMFNILLFSPQFINENIFKFFIGIQNIIHLSVFDLTRNNVSCA